MANKFKVGDLVAPNFGSYLKMAVMQVYANGDHYNCSWMEDNQMRDKDFPEVVLLPYSEAERFPIPKPRKRTAFK